VNIFLGWTFLRAVFHRGYVLVALLYFVLDAHLSASQLTLLGTITSVTMAFFNIPAGVLADAIGRRWPLVIGHLFLAAGMVMTGLVVAFSPLVVTGVLWGVGWALKEGADVAWITEELNRPELIDRVLTGRARCDLIGGVIGMLSFGAIGWSASLTTALVVSGSGMALLGLFVAANFKERNFKPARGNQLNASLSIVRRGLLLAVRDHEVFVAMTATMIINGAAIAAWVFPKQLVNLRFPNDPILWWTAIEILSFAVGVASLYIVEPRIDGAVTLRQTYSIACFIGVLGIVVLAYASDVLIGAVGVVLAAGVGFNVTRPVSVIWVNRRAESSVRATVQSCLSQTESIGEILGGLALSVLGSSGGIRTALLASGALVALAGVAVAASTADRTIADAETNT
jgi:predicted MFS family arabinose efflux permease